MEEALGQNKVTLERLYLLAGLRTPWCTPVRAGGGGWGEEGLRLTADAVSPRDLDPNRWMKMYGWTVILHEAANLF